MMEIKEFRRTFFILIIGVALLFCTVQEVLANNLLIENFRVSDVNQSADQMTFSCDVSWDNSWRSADNYDSVWVFMKYSTDAGVTWQHASMAANGLNPNGFSTPVGFELRVPSDETGFFLQRSDLNSGNASAEGIQFVWDYNQDGLNDEEAMAANTINKVFGIEMVYIPKGAFHAGDGNSSSDYRFKQGSTDNEPWYITSELSFNTTSAPSDGYYYTSTGQAGESSTGSPTFLIPEKFPKGYQAFYLMKYELTEGQWVSFFNTLSLAEKINRDITSSTHGGKNSDADVDGVKNRNTISWDASNPKSLATTLRPDRPVTYVSWADITAYADWAGLRPITELEFEKAARGVIDPVANEYAWGTTSYTSAGATEIFPNADEDGSETINQFNNGANINNNSLSWTSGDGRSGGIADGQKGPLRAGIFAENSTIRETSGASYYGVLELSGNLSEMVVTVGSSKGRKFLGSHGDGELSSASSYEGNATNIDWPGSNNTDSVRGVTGAEGSGYRGGDFQSPNSRYFQISTRTNAVKYSVDGNDNAQRYDGVLKVFGAGRLGRTAP